jgi:hypothetical protein
MNASRWHTIARSPCSSYCCARATADSAGRALNPRVVDDALHQVEKNLRERAGEVGRLMGRRPRIEPAVGDPAVAMLEEARPDGKSPALIAVGNRGLSLAKTPEVGQRLAQGHEGP